MKVIIAGSTGMIGKLILEKCLQSNQISEITTLVRKPSPENKNDKIKEIIVSNFEDFSGSPTVFQDIDIAFFCIGAYTGQVADDLFKKITVNYAVSFSEALKNESPNATLCFLSGAGADRTEKSRTAFARYKGMAENRIAKTGLTFHSFRPGYIYPVTPRKEPNMMYKIFRILYPILKLLGKNASIKSTELAQAMFLVGLHGADKEILENKDIFNQL
ncbi:NAD(P)H-binding protein [Thalassobellus citreus]|uniref:NAD(P)H-binding protein n=1 Tax=Thalassobellus citreus TaxID=3367752 RepID=UPI003799A533